jgi:hypothetical protein
MQVSLPSIIAGIIPLTRLTTTADAVDDDDRRWAWCMITIRNQQNTRHCKGSEQRFRVSVIRVTKFESASHEILELKLVFRHGSAAVCRLLKPF